MTWKLTGVLTSRSQPTILVHEWVTGGGMADAALEPSWAVEGHAMRRAIAREFSALNDGHCQVVMTLDHRFADEPGPWAVEPIAAGQHPMRLLARAREADYTVLIAPETMSILEKLTRGLQDAGARHLGSSPEAVALAGDKCEARRMACRPGDRHAALPSRDTIGGSPRRCRLSGGPQAARWGRFRRHVPR